VKIIREDALLLYQLLIIYFAQQDVIPTGQKHFFFAYAQKIKPFTGPIQNGSVHSPRRISGNK
jgi:hypothetical protein